MPTKYVKIPRSMGDKAKLTEQAKSMGVDQEFYYDDEDEPKPGLTVADQQSVMKPESAVKTKAIPSQIEAAQGVLDTKKADKLTSLNSAAEGMSSLGGYIKNAGFSPLVAMGLNKKISAMTPQQQAEIWAKLQSLKDSKQKDAYLQSLP